MPNPIEIAERVLQGKPLKEFIIPQEAQRLHDAVETVTREAYEYYSRLRSKRDPGAKAMERVYQKARELYQFWKDSESRSMM